MSRKKPPEEVMPVNAMMGEIVNACRTIITENDKKVYKAENTSKSKPNSTKGNNDSQSTKALENVIIDMTNILQDLRSIKKINRQLEKKYSLKTIEKELENTYQKQKQIENEAKRNQVKLNKEETKNNNINSNTKQKQNNSSSKPINRKPNSAPSDNKQSVATKGQKPLYTECKTTNEPHKLKNSSNKPNQQRPAPKRTSKPLVPVEVYNPLGLLKAEVAQAIAERKTFTVRGCYPVIRQALLERGWVEKFNQQYRNLVSDEIRKFQIYSIPELVELLRNKELTQLCKKLIKSKLLADHQVDLYWDHTYDAYKECPDGKKLTLINRIRRSALSFTSKQGLCETVKDWLWLEMPNFAGIRHPRAYILTRGGDTKEFVQDFDLTAAISILKWIVQTDSSKECKIVSSAGKISLKYLDFALTECYKFIKFKKHQDIDESITEASEKEWSEFLDQFDKIIHVGNHFKLENNYNADIVSSNMVRKATYLLNILGTHLQYLHTDGMMNIWILKPSGASQGKGIHVCRSLNYIFNIIKNNPSRRYVIQKYIEKPLLIHNTKFDIRQWFLLSSTTPMTVWMYKTYYLRFSSQTYNLRNLHESIHLTNNSVQCHYLQSVVKDPIIPKYLMWDSKQFKNYLSNIGYPDVYEEIVYKGMKECITAAMISHSDKVDKRKNCFELFGADFILDEYFQPWLLEINSHPALQASTPVTARLCPRVLEDVIKVVVDWDRNKNAKTGEFQMIYRETAVLQNPKLKLELSGKQLTDEYFFTPSNISSNLSIIRKLNEQYVSENNRELILTPVYSVKEFLPLETTKFLQKTGEAMRIALKNLMELVKTEKQRRRKKKEVSVKTMSIIDVNSSVQTSLEIVPK